MEFALDDRLSSEQRLSFFEHVTSCPSCRDLYVSMSLIPGRDDIPMAEAVAVSPALQEIRQTAPGHMMKRVLGSDAARPSSDMTMGHRELPRAESESDGVRVSYNKTTLSGYVGIGETEHHIRRESGRRSLWSPAICAVLGGLLVTAIVLGQSGDDATELVLSRSHPAAEKLQVEDPDKTNEAAIDDLLHHAEQAMVAKDWDRTRDLLAEAKGIEGAAEQGIRLDSMANRLLAEKQSQKQFDELRSAAEKQRIDHVLNALGLIPEDSAYRADALAMAIGAVRMRGQRLLRRGDCKGLTAMVALVVRTLPELHDEFQRLSTTCMQTAATAPKPAANSSKRDAEQIFAKVEDSYRRNLLLRASKHCQELRELGQVSEDAGALCGLVACRNQDLPTADWYYNRALRRESRNLIAAACARSLATSRSND
jgi:hypothetical protein